jgi:hypothetical protein
VALRVLVHLALPLCLWCAVAVAIPFMTRKRFPMPHDASGAHHPNYTVWTPAECWARDGCFCEAPLPSTGVAVHGTYSNYAYLVAALYVLLLGPVFRSLVMRTAFVVALVVQALGSALYHATFTTTGETLDFLGMYLLATFQFIWLWHRGCQYVEHGLGRARPYNPDWLLLVVWVVLGGSLALVEFYYHSEANRAIFALAVLAGNVAELVLVVLGRRRNVSLPLYYTFLGTWCAASVVWALEQWVPELCFPHSYLQLHTLWHITTAVAAVLLYHYWASERVCRTRARMHTDPIK